MEAVHCPLCGADEGQFLWSKRGARYDRCPQCHLVYENPRLTQEELKEFYSSPEYFVRGSSDEPTSGYENYFQQCTAPILEEYFRIIQRHSPGPGRLLDVGCGPGGLLSIAQAHGWEATGLEISSWAVKEGRRQGLTIIERPLPEADIQSGSVDVVSMFDVLEHLTEPVMYLRESRRVLQPGGIVIIETPNVDGFFVRRVYRENADLVKPRAHISLYGPRSAKHLLAVAGFTRFTVSTFPYSRRISLGYLKSVALSRFRRGAAHVQLTWNDSLRIVGWK